MCFPRLVSPRQQYLRMIERDGESREDLKTVVTDFIDSCGDRTTLLQMRTELEKASPHAFFVELDIPTDVLEACRALVRHDSFFLRFSRTTSAYELVHSINEHLTRLDQQKVQIKTYPNPAITRITRDGQRRYVFQSPTDDKRTTVFEYPTCAAKSLYKTALGAGGYGDIYGRRNPHASMIADKTTSDSFIKRSSEERFDFYNALYEFVHKKGIEKFFNVPLFTTDRHQLQRRIDGGDCNSSRFRDYVRTHPEITEEHWRRMRSEFATAYSVFSQSYIHGDFNRANVMFDEVNQCFVLVDFDRTVRNYRFESCSALDTPIENPVIMHTLFIYTQV